jgi:hypothetical protein
MFKDAMLKRLVPSVSEFFRFSNRRFCAVVLTSQDKPEQSVALAGKDFRIGVVDRSTILIFLVVIVTITVLSVPLSCLDRACGAHLPPTISLFHCDRIPLYQYPSSYYIDSLSDPWTASPMFTMLSPLQSALFSYSAPKASQPTCPPVSWCRPA